MDEIDWSDRLIGIKGSRGVGKTSFLLQYAKENFHPSDKKCLYINLNNFYFSVKTIQDFAREFWMKDCHFLIDGQYPFCVGEPVRGEFNPEVYYAMDGIEEEEEQRFVPLWLFGLLY